MSTFCLLSDHGKERVSHLLPKYIKQESFDCLTLEDVTDRLFRNVYD